VHVTARFREFVVDTFLLGDDDGFDDDSLIEGGIVDSITRLRAFVDGKVAAAAAPDGAVAVTEDAAV
jgi:hypothetical protein